MTIQDIDNQIKLKRTELQITVDYEKKQKIQKQIRVLNFKKEIEIIKFKIQQLG